MCRRVIHIVLVATSFLGLQAPDNALAYDDDIDFTAPYLTLEDGALVTKYPDAAKDPNHPATRPAAADDSVTGPSIAAPFAASPTDTGRRSTPLNDRTIFVASIIVLLVAAVTIRIARRGRHT